MATNYSKIVSFCSYNIYRPQIPTRAISLFWFFFSNHGFPRVYTHDDAVGLKMGYFTFDPIIATAK